MTITLPRAGTVALPARSTGDITTRTTRHTVSLVATARDECTIPWVFEQIPSCVDEVILVDDESALRTAFAAAGGEYVVMMAADGSMWPGEIPHYLHFLDNGYDFVKGSRRMAGGGSPGLDRARSVGNRILLALVNRLYRSALTDLCYGFCAFRRSLLDGLPLRSSGPDIEAELTAHVLRSGLRITEVPSLELPRRTGRSTLHAVTDGRRALRILVAERPRPRRPLPWGR